MDKEFSETIAGSYRSMKMPDGTVELFVQVNEDGAVRWKMLRDHEREQRERKAFEERFAHTETRPDDHQPSGSSPLTKKPKIIGEFDPYPSPGDLVDSTLGADTANLSKTRRHMYAHLIAVLGGHPQNIINNGVSPAVIANLKKNTAHAETVMVMIRALNMPQWTAVGDMLAKVLRDASTGE